MGTVLIWVALWLADWTLTKLADAGWEAINGKIRGAWRRFWR